MLDARWCEGFFSCFGVDCISCYKFQGYCSLCYKILQYENFQELKINQQKGDFNKK